MKSHALSTGPADLGHGEALKHTAYPVPNRSIVWDTPSQNVDRPGPRFQASNSRIPFRTPTEPSKPEPTPPLALLPGAQNDSPTHNREPPPLIPLGDALSDTLPQTTRAQNGPGVPVSDTAYLDATQPRTLRTPSIVNTDP